MRLIRNPPSPGSRWTLAVVSTDVGVKPAASSPADRAIEKQPACAAPISSSGLVPVPSSKRDENEYWPSKAPLPRRMVPLPSRSPPCQRAVAVRAGMSCLPRSSMEPALGCTLGPTLGR